MKKFIKLIAVLIVMSFVFTLVGCGGFTEKTAKEINSKVGMADAYTYYKLVEEYGAPIDKNFSYYNELEGDSIEIIGYAVWVNGCSSLREYELKYNSGEEVEVLTVEFLPNYYAVNATFKVVNGKTVNTPTVNTPTIEDVTVAEVTFWLVLLYIVIGIIAICIQLIVCYAVHEIALSKDRNGFFWTISAFFGGITILLCIAFIPSLKQAPVYYSQKYPNSTTNTNTVPTPSTPPTPTPTPKPKPAPKPVPTWPCPKCGERNNINAKSCIECGEIRPEQFSPKEKPKPNPQEQSKVWKCPKCGEMNNVRYCVSCGEARPK